MKIYLSYIVIALSLCLSASPATATNPVNIVYEFDHKTPPGNIAVSKKERIFLSTHHFFGSEHKIVEIQSDGKAVAYPNAKFSKSLNPVLGVIVDTKDVLWILETASAKDRAGRLIGWDINKNQLYKMIYIAAPVIPENSFLNDIAIDRTNEAVYITDTAAGKNSALIVVDLKTGETRRVLEGSAFTKPEDIDMVIDNKQVTLGGQPARIGANPITIDHKNEWVYFAPMTSTAMYRVKTKDLLDTALTPSELTSRVETFGKKPISDGITIDNQGNVYITDITNNAVGYMDPKGKYHTLSTDDEVLSWTDGFANGNGKTIYITANKLHRSPVLNGGVDESQGKFYILSIEAKSAVSQGR